MTAPVRPAPGSLEALLTLLSRSAPADAGQRTRPPAAPVPTMGAADPRSMAERKAIAGAIRTAEHRDLATEAAYNAPGLDRLMPLIDMVKGAVNRDPAGVAAGAGGAMLASVPFAGRAIRPMPKIAFREVDHDLFRDAVAHFMAERPHEAGFLTPRTTEQMRAEGMRTFLTKDGKAGFAVAPDGDIRNVFNHGPTKGAGRMAVIEAVTKHGGTKLDNFDTGLSHVYQDLGFRELKDQRLPWDPQYAPSHWNAEKYGTPDVIFQEYAGGDRTPQQMWNDAEMAAAARRRDAPRVAKEYGGDYRKLTETARSFRDSPDVVAERVRLAREALKVPPEPYVVQPRGLVDRSVIRPDEGITPGDPVHPRAVPSDRAAMAPMADMANPDNVDLIIRQIQRGRPAGEMFYPSYAAVNDAIGQAGGDPVLFRKATSAGSIQTPVHNELAHASMMLTGHNRGIVTLDEIRQAKTVAERMALRERLVRGLQRDFPEFNGRTMLNQQHLQSWANLVDGAAPNAYKLPTYDVQKAGDVPGIVLDTHEGKGQTLGSRFHRLFADQGGFSNVQYPVQESFFRQIAHNLGFSDRSAQAMRWIGGGNVTGLVSAPTDYAQIFEDMIMHNAQQRGLDPRALMGEIARGENILLPFWGRKGFSIW